jgi:hypothetical protein
LRVEVILNNLCHASTFFMNSSGYQLFFPEISNHRIFCHPPSRKHTSRTRHEVFKSGFPGEKGILRNKKCWLSRRQGLEKEAGLRRIPLQPA